MGPAGSDANEWRILLARLAREHGRGLFRAAAAILRDPVAAEDACQQAFLKALDPSHGIRDAAAMRAWLHRVVVNEALQTLRRRKTHAALLGQAPPADRPRGHDEQVAVRESVAAALERLPEPTRTVVALRVMEGRSGLEVARDLDLCPSEVSRRLHAGLDELRLTLREWRNDLPGPANPTHMEIPGPREART